MLSVMEFLRSNSNSSESNDGHLQVMLLWLWGNTSEANLKRQTTKMEVNDEKRECEYFVAISWLIAMT
jgi:hypothetical protein